MLIGCILSGSTHTDTILIIYLRGSYTVLEWLFGDITIVCCTLPMHKSRNTILVVNR